MLGTSVSKKEVVKVLCFHNNTFSVLLFFSFCIFKRLYDTNTIYGKKIVENPNFRIHFKAKIGRTVEVNCSSKKSTRTKYKKPTRNLTNTMSSISFGARCACAVVEAWLVCTHPVHLVTVMQSFCALINIWTKCWRICS